MVPRKIPAFDSSAKDFLLRKDVPEKQNVNGSASKPQMKEEQTSGSAPPSTQITQERSAQKGQIHETSGGNQNLGSQSRQSPATSNLAGGGTGTCSKDPPSVKHENPGLASFLSFAPPGVFSTATPAANPNEVKKSTANNATGTQTPAPMKVAETARPSRVEVTGKAQVSQLTQKNLETVAPGNRGPKENGQVGINGKSHQPVGLVDGNPTSASQTNKAPEARSDKTAPTPQTVLEPKEASQPTPTAKPAPKTSPKPTGPSEGTKQPTPTVKPALKTALQPTGPSEGTKKPTPTVEPALKTAPEPKKPSGEENQPKVIAETVFKQTHEPVVALKSLPNGYVKEQPLDDKPSENSPLRPQAEDFSPHPDLVPVPHNSPQPMLDFHSPRLMSPVNATAISMDNLQRFIPTGVTTGQLVTTTQVSILGGKMTPGESRGTLYMQTPVSIQHGTPQPQGGSVPATRASSQEVRSHIQLKPTQGLASSRWNKQ
ncbi:unnamed protein product [Clonostachys rhizophaga]|uniref:Uncharacterized protein n=1 Tax=Clonostachys rhizophaga TaxID=160324 RepID=A0A9N9V8P7_9HYPO|nr:unnamed protein product [Clonostachys rhizophaga]